MTGLTRFILGAMIAMVIALPSVAVAGSPSERIVVKILDAEGAPVPWANVLAMEGTSTYLRQALVRADSNGIAVTEIGADAYLGLQVVVEGYETWKLALAPGAPDRRRKVIEVRLQRRPRGPVIPVVF